MCQKGLQGRGGLKKARLTEDGDSEVKVPESWKLTNGVNYMFQVIGA